MALGTRVAETTRREDGGEASLRARLVQPFHRFRQFIHEVRAELRNVNWPGKNNVRSTTAVVIITVFVFGLFLFVVDSLVSRAMQYVLTTFRQ